MAMTMIRPQGTPQQEYSLLELERARSAELAGRVAASEQSRAAGAANGTTSLFARVRLAIGRRLRRR